MYLIEFYFILFFLRILFCPGCPAEHDRGCRSDFDTFQGCMRSFTLDSKPVDLILVQQKLLGNFSNLLIDICGIIDRCVTNQTGRQKTCYSQLLIKPTHSGDDMRTSSVLSSFSWFFTGEESSILAVFHQTKLS